MYQATRFIELTLRRNCFVDALFNRLTTDARQFICSHYRSIINRHRSDPLTNEAIAFALTLEYIYAYPSMSCDVLYKSISQITLPGAGLLDNIDDFEFMVSYAYKRGNCDEIFIRHSSLLKHVYGINPSMNELICDIFDVGERHLENQLFKSMLCIVERMR